MKKGMNAKSFNKVLYVIIGIVVSTTLVISAYLVFILNKTSQEVSKNKYVSISNNTKVEALAELEKSLKDLSSEESKINSFMPDEKEVSQILKDWEIMAVSKGLSWTVMKVGDEQAKSSTPNKKQDESQTVKSGDFYIFPYQITLRGSFDKVDIMIRDIEEYKRLAEIKEVKYTKDPAIPGDFVEAVLQVNAYLRK